MKVGKKIYNAISAVILIALVGLVILLIGVRFIGFTPYAVLSGSMEPKFPVGSVVYVKDVDADKIEVGDAITFYMSDSSTVVTHQVIDIDEEEGLYYTQGVANDAADGTPATVENIIGKVYLCIPYLGYISTYITSPPWIYIIVCLGLMWILFIYMVDVWKEEGDKEKEQKKLEQQREDESRRTKRTQTRERTDYRDGSRRNVRRRGPREHKKRKR